MRHRNKRIGPFYVVCRSDQFWRVEYQGQVLYSVKRRYMAIRKAEKLLKAYDKLLEEGGRYVLPTA